MASDQEEMDVLEVDKKLLKELGALGFSRARAARGLHYSGNYSLEDAVNWIVDHENDEDIDEMPLVAVNIEIESPLSDHSIEEVEKKLQDIRNRIRQRKEEATKLDRDREKARIQAGKELLQAKRIAVENERKRFLASRKDEKEEVKRAREKIRQKIEVDKAERRRQLGFPLENSTYVNHSNPIVHDQMIPLKMQSSPVMTIAKAEHMRDCLRSLRRNYKDDDARIRRAFLTLLIYVGNIIKNPNEEKYRKIRLGNRLFQERVGSLKGGIDFLELCGFERTEEGDFLRLPGDKLHMEVLNTADSILMSALTNPFFGLLSGQ